MTHEQRAAQLTLLGWTGFDGGEDFVLPRQRYELYHKAAMWNVYCSPTRVVKMRAYAPFGYTELARIADMEVGVLILMYDYIMMELPHVS
jgi:hypothetical protein